jgi:hypothetical protein
MNKSNRADLLKKRASSHQISNRDSTSKLTSKGSVSHEKFEKQATMPISERSELVFKS